MSRSLGRECPLQEVIDAIVNAINSEIRKDVKLPELKCFLDVEKKDIEALARKLVQLNDDEGVLLVKTPVSTNVDKLHQEWQDLLESVIRETGCGLSPSSIDGVIKDLLAFTKPLRVSMSIPALEPENLKIVSHEAPADANEINEAIAKLRAWALLEKYSGLDYAPLFSRIAGGIRPTVIVFDDYNNYIKRESDSYSPVATELLEQAQQAYGEEIETFLRSHCKNLNNLLVFCDVQAYKLWPGKKLESGEKPDPLSKQVAEALPVESLESMRDRIGAFLVDLEWSSPLGESNAISCIRGDGGWSESKAGFRAIRLLSLRFPEIPCFVYTGSWSDETLLESLGNGARWCFYKESHHTYSATKRFQITNLELERHLCSASEAVFGAFSEIPFAEQCVLDPKQKADKSLIDALDLHLPLESDANWQEIGRIIAKLFPNGERVRPVKVFDSGKSKAQAAFVVRSIHDGVESASRFLKIGPWLEILREYFAYQRTIRPRVNSNVANIVDPPVLAGGIRGGMPIGMVVYSMAGLPEDYDDLIPLDKLLRHQCSEKDTDQCAQTRLEETLKKVLWPLYGKDTETGRLVREQPLWSCLGEVLPPVFTGVLVPLDGLGENRSELVIGSWRRKGYKDSTAWQLAAMDTRRIEEIATDEKTLSPWCLQGKRIELLDFQLMEVEWSAEEEVGEITLAHPDLGWRVRLRGKAGDIRRRFGAIWVRPGLSVQVVAIIERSNHEIEKIRNRVLVAIDTQGLTDSACTESETADLVSILARCAGVDSGFPDPFTWLGSDYHIPYSFTISARKSPIHGDLNLQNILFADKIGPGWLIDFERSVPKGMPAFDLAKLEAEIWHHHLFGLIEQLGAVLSVGVDGEVANGRMKLMLLQAALKAAESSGNSSETFKTMIRAQGFDAVASDGLLSPICTLLDTVAMVRTFGKERLKLSKTEQSWALAAYFFSATKFARGDQPWRALFSIFASAIHLGTVVHKKCDGVPDWGHLFRQIRDGGASAVNTCKLDELLIYMSDKQCDLDSITVSMGEVPPEKRLVWPEDTQRWDLASTGSINNITPIFGYLWLMVKAQREKEKNDGKYKVMVPKISSRGGSGGTVDILESGGLNFPADPDVIVERCNSDGGVLCRQDDSLTPVDKVLMKRRKKTNTMKSAALVYASILAKKIAMGCTHAIVDVKVGRDCKIITPGMGDVARKALVTEVPSKLLPKCADKFKMILDLIRDESPDSWTSKIVKEDQDLQWIEQTVNWSKNGNYPALTNVRWFFTNSDLPQCRASGRQLMLLHLDDLICETYGDKLLGISPYQSLYKELISKLCDIDYDDDKFESLREEWRKLKSRLPRWGGFVLAGFFDELKKLRECENKRDGDMNKEVQKKAEKINYLDSVMEEKGLPIIGTVDLKVLTLPIECYQLSARPGSKVSRIDAWGLDSLFDWLCGAETHDPEVGIYLHRMPGEEVMEPNAEPFISVFFRPSRTKEEVLKGRLRRFLSDGVAFEGGG